MTDAPITQQEMNAILDFFKAKNIAWLGTEGDKNGETVGNYFDLWAQSTPTKQTIPFSPQALEVAFKELHDSLIFYSADESRFHLYEEKYPEQLETIRKFLPSYRLSTEGDDLFVNTNIIMEYCISTGRVHQITKESLQTVVVGNLINRPGVRAFHYMPTPSQVAQQKRWEDTRTSESRKTARQLAEDKAAAVRHIRTNDGRLLSDVILEATPDPEPTQSEKRLAHQKAKLGKDNDSYWQQRVQSYINSIQSNLVRAEAEQLFGKQMNGNWEVNYRSLENWLSRKQSAGHWY